VLCCGVGKKTRIVFELFYWFQSCCSLAAEDSDIMMNKALSAQPSPSFRSFFEPDVLTAHRFLKVYHQKGQLGPEERLMFAVLTDAIECFQKYFDAHSRRCRALFGEAASWIESTDSSWPFSFEQICQTLNISPSYLRVGLTRWRLSHQNHKFARKRIREPLRYQYRVKRSRISASSLPMG
jgi:hypothetical protein